METDVRTTERLDSVVLRGSGLNAENTKGNKRDISSEKISPTV